MAKNCVNHLESHAVADCAVCGKSVCLMCVEEDTNASYCSGDCAASGRSRLAEASIDAPRAQKGACVNHPDSKATSYCQVCDKALCASCMIQTPEGTVCTPACLEV